MRAARSIRRPDRRSRLSDSAAARSTTRAARRCRPRPRAWETLQAARAAIASFGAAVRAAQIALEGTQQEALVGSRTVLDVLIAEQQLFTTQSQLVAAQHDAALAEFNLAAAIGRLIAPELKLPVQLYDMDRHYKEVKDKWLGFGGGLKEYGSAAGPLEIRRPFRSLAGPPAFWRFRRCPTASFDPNPQLFDPEPSMDEILASIRRIIAEDNRAADRGAGAGG